MKKLDNYLLKFVEEFVVLHHVVQFHVDYIIFDIINRFLFLSKSIIEI